tara:strand:+ start:290 stop:679 length:390 start_codon:yes stop_codon:yes gene_type:complete
MARKGQKKDTYWHNIAQLGLSNGLPPAQVGRLVKEVFPETDINGRHIGAYKRRLVDEDTIVIPARPTMTVQELMGMVHGLVTDEDKFAYTCSIGSTKRSLKCFEYKLTAELEDKNELENIDEWISTLRK